MKSVIYVFIYVHMYIVFSIVCSCVRLTNNLDSVTDSTFHSNGSSPDLVLPGQTLYLIANASPRTAVLHTHRLTKGNKLKRRREREREKPDRKSQKYKIRIIAKQAIILILSSSLAYSMLCVS